ncbi:mechanosensitive ion channel protein MscS, partial [bacterium DOLZORAL124_64_63]
MAFLEHLAERTIGPWPLVHLLTAFGFLVGGFLLRAAFNAIVARRLKSVAEKTATEADDMAVAALVSPLGVILPVLGIFLAARLLLNVQPKWLHYADTGFRIATIIVVAWTVLRMIDAAAVLFADMSTRTRSKLDDQFIPLLRKAAKAFVFILAFILTAQNLGYSVSGLVAGLGIGGLALAMAAKDTLANLFGSLMILIDQPFHVGDWITFPGGDGVVEEIGLRSTRVRTFAKTVVSIPNHALANATVENHSLMPKRRIKFTLGVTYDSSVEQIRQLVADIENYLRSNGDIEQEFMLVKFTTFNECSLDLFVYCFTVTTDWTQHLA